LGCVGQGFHPSICRGFVRFAGRRKQEKCAHCKSEAGESG
jgi:hypothetical protein